MDVYKIAICENNINILNEMHNIIVNYYRKHEIIIDAQKFRNGKDFLDASVSNNFNIIFMDIDLGDYNGVKLIEDLRHKNRSIAQVIFITSYSEYKEQVLSLHTFDYLTKPFSKNKVESVLNELSIWISKDNNKEGIDISFKTTEGLVTIDIRNILYFEYINRKIEIITTYKKFEMYGSMKDLITKLSDFNFVSPHAAYIVNLQHIQLLAKDRNVIMKNGEQIPIAQTKQKEFRKIYFAYIS